mgnify:CR=1 FL=1
MNTCFVEPSMKHRRSVSSFLLPKFIPSLSRTIKDLAPREKRSKDNAFGLNYENYVYDDAAATDADGSSRRGATAMSKEDNLLIVVASRNYVHQNPI